MRIILIALFAVLMAVVAMIFGGLNDQEVTIDLIFTVQTLNLSYLLLIVFTLGMVLGISIGLTLYLPKLFANKLLGKHNQKIEKELSNLRSLPIRDDY